jgi:hypothetical protein
MRDAVTSKGADVATGPTTSTCPERERLLAGVASLEAEEPTWMRP